MGETMQHILNASIVQRLMAALVAILLASGATIALAGCTSNDESAIRGGIAEQLDLLKNPTKDNIATIIATSSNSAFLSTLETYGVDKYEYYQHVLRGFDYSIGKIEVSGDTATAEVAVTNLNVKNVMEETMNRLKSDPESASKLAEINQSEGHAAMMRYVFSALFEALDAVTESTTTDVTLKLTKNGNKWSIDEDSETVLSEAIYGNSIQI